MFILIDDERNVEEVVNTLPHLTIDKDKFYFDKIVRSFEEFKKEIKNITEHDTLFLDHDLGTDKVGQDGHHVIKMLFEHKIFPKKVYIVSANPVGLNNIQKVLIHDMKYVQQVERVFVRG